ncbi:MAG: Fic/DOC family protein [Corynebacterium variabile]
MGDTPENFFGITDSAELEELGGEFAARRLGELERSAPLTSFTRQDLCHVHSYLMQDVYPWAGQLRTTVVGAMGMAMCRAQYVDQELDRVFRDIARRPPSTSDVGAAVATVADYRAELTMVHPFRDGNSRTQRIFFDQMLRHAGWSVNWTLVSAEQVHAARYVGAATVDSSYLAQVLRPGVLPAAEIGAASSGLSLSATEGRRDNRSAAESFHDMMAFRRTHPRGVPYRPGL